MSESETRVFVLCERRRRIIFRSWRRGMREMDLILGRFSEAHIAGLSDSELDDYERLLEVPDGDVFSWIAGRARIPACYDTPLLRKIRNFHSGIAP